MTQLYSYVGPPEIAHNANLNSVRTRLGNEEDVRRWASSGFVTLTFVVDAFGEMWIADRHSEHAACARGGPVLSAGEITFQISPTAVTVTEVTNQSTGYCPRIDSWPAVEWALKKAQIDHPDTFTSQYEFRRCRCGQINLVKDDLYVCSVCNAQLSEVWNLDS